ncbi:MAG: globin domain-containing protein [Flavobacteriales bacterium]
MEPANMRFPDVLYEELFIAEPQLRILFEGPMDEQHRKLTLAISNAVEHMSEPETMVRHFHDLGQRHSAYGVRPYHYIAFKAAFLATVQRTLGPDHTPETNEAWSELMDMLSSAMQG